MEPRADGISRAVVVLAVSVMAIKELEITIAATAIATMIGNFLLPDNREISIVFDQHRHPYQYYNPITTY